MMKYDRVNHICNTTSCEHVLVNTENTKNLITARKLKVNVINA